MDEEEKSIIGSLRRSASNSSHDLDDSTASEILQLDDHAEQLALEREHERNLITKMALADIHKHKQQPSEAEVEKAVKTAMHTLHGFGQLERALRNSHEVDDIPAETSVQIVDEQLEEKLKALTENVAEKEMIEESRESIFTYKQIMFMIAVLFCLYFPDLWEYKQVPEEFDIYRDMALVCCFFLFLYEVTELSLTEAGYFGSLFFVLDIFGTLSLILEWSWLLRHIHNNGAAPSILRVTRVTKLAVRSKEIFKLFGWTMRLLRLFRPLYMYVKTSTEENLIVQLQKLPSFVKTSSRKILPIHIEPVTTPTPTTLADTKQFPHLYNHKQLHLLDKVEAKTREVNEAFAFRVAGVCMILTIALPFLQPDVVDYSAMAFIRTLKMMGKDHLTSTSQLHGMFRKIEHYYTPKATTLFELHYESPYWMNESISIAYGHHAHIRHEALVEYVSQYTVSSDIDTVQQTKEYEIWITLDRTQEMQEEAVFSLLTTTLVVMVIFFGTKFLTEICNAMLIIPLTDALLSQQNDAEADVKAGDNTGIGKKLPSSLALFPSKRNFSQQNSEQSLHVQASKSLQTVITR